MSWHEQNDRAPWLPHGIRIGWVTGFLPVFLLYPFAPFPTALPNKGSGRVPEINVTTYSLVEDCLTMGQLLFLKFTVKHGLCLISNALGYRLFISQTCFKNWANYYSQNPNILGRNASESETPESRNGSPRAVVKPFLFSEFHFLLL